MKILASAIFAIAPALTGTASLMAKDDIVDTAVKSGAFKTLAAAVTEAGLIDTLKGEGPFTVFAPTDDAFAKLPEGTVESLLKPENREKLVAILTYHVVPGRVLAKDALNAENAATVQGDSLAFRLESGTLRVNDSTVVQNDVECSNGVIHVIDSVLLPPEPKTRKVIGFYPGHPSKKQRALLGLDKNEGLLVERVVRQSGAEEAGMNGHDIIVAVNGKPATSRTLDDAKSQVDAGDFIELTIARTIRVRVGEEN